MKTRTQGGRAVDLSHRSAVYLSRSRSVSIACRLDPAGDVNDVVESPEPARKKSADESERP